MPATRPTPPTFEVRVTDGTRCLVTLSGDWLLQAGLPQVAPLDEALASARHPREVLFDASRLGRWDFGLLVFLARCHVLSQRHDALLTLDALPDGVIRLLRLAQAVPEKKDARRPRKPRGLLQSIGTRALVSLEGVRGALAFLGETALAASRLVRRKARFPWPDAALIFQECGPRAIGIVALINFIVGMILAFVGTVQLRQFGASIYVADLVGIAIVREMACLMTGIILCGRTGAAFAAQLGTMTVNEEIDALETFGLSPIDYLVLPRVLALVLAMPFLCAFADVLGILGGLIVATSLPDLTVLQYLGRTAEAITLSGFLLGLFKGSVFGLIVALTGCHRGLHCGHTAAAVGLATTSAVVVGITAIIATDGLFAILTTALDI